jgi:trigger factor
MVDAQVARFVENFRTQIQSQGISYDQYLKLTGMDESKLKEDAREPALRQVRLDLALAAIIKEEKLEASDDEIEEEYKRMSEKYHMEVDTVKKYLQKEAVEDQVKTQKAIDLVTESATAVKPEEKPEEPSDEKEAGDAKTESGEKKKPAARKSAAKTGDEKKPAAKKSAAKAGDGVEKKPAAKKSAQKEEK